MYRCITVLVLIIFLGACSTTASLTFYSNPPGASIVELSSNKIIGKAPLKVEWDLDVLKRAFSVSDKCYHVGNYEARWVSGAWRRVNDLRLCPPGPHWHYTFLRPSSVPGVEIDLQAARLDQERRYYQEMQEYNKMLQYMMLFGAMQSLTPKRPQTSFTDCTVSPLFSDSASVNCTTVK